MSEQNEKRMVADTGYEVKYAIPIGDREILIAENMNEPDGLFYMKAEYSDNGIIGQYDRCIYSSSYIAIIEELTASLYRQTTALRNEIANYDPAPITAAQCHPNDYGQSIEGKVVAIKASALRPEYRRGDVQLVYVTGGNGAKANARGSAVYCCHLSDGKHTRYERRDVQGEIMVLPDWATERLEAVKAQIDRERVKVREDRRDTR